MKTNYQQKLDGIIESIKQSGVKPRLLLHMCCAPCATYCVEYLDPHFEITGYFYNPNIHPIEEYEKRFTALEKFLSVSYPHIKLIKGEYAEDIFNSLVKGREDDPEGGARCGICCAHRVDQAAKCAAVEGFEYFASTLSISPHKNAQLLNSAGEQASQKYGVAHLPNDFKKRGGFLRSTQICTEKDIYRQNYCGCTYSMPKL